MTTGYLAGFMLVTVASLVLGYLAVRDWRKGVLPYQWASAVVIVSASTIAQQVNDFLVRLP